MRQHARKGLPGLIGSIALLIGVLWFVTRAPEQVPEETVAPNEESHSEDPVRPSEPPMHEPNEQIVSEEKAVTDVPESGPVVQEPTESSVEDFNEFLASVREKGTLPVEWEERAVDLLKTRKRGLKDLIVSDPEEALTRALSEADRALFPDSMQTYMEQSVSGTGDLMLGIACSGYHEDGVHPSSEMWREAYIGKDRFMAHVYGAKENTMSMENIPLRGIAIDDQMAVHESPLEVVEVTAGDSPQIRVRFGDRDLSFSNRTSYEVFRQQVAEAEQNSVGPVVTYPEISQEL